MARGRMAIRPTQIPRKGWLDIAARVKSRIGADKLTLIAAGVAFFGLLALFPAITAVLAVGGLVLDRRTIVEQLARLEGVVPGDVLRIIRDQATSVAEFDGLGMTLFVAIALALWSASRGINVLSDGLNVAYGEEEDRGFLIKNLHVLGLTVGIIVGLIVMLAALVGVPALLAVIPLGVVADLAARLASWALMAALVIGGLAVIYRYGPSRANARWSWVTPGALLACVGWIVASIAFTIYVANFASYNESFGALAGVVILLMWLWITVLVVLIGAEINAEMEHQTRMDSTTGTPAPMGQRGAEMADTLGEIRNG